MNAGQGVTFGEVNDPERRHLRGVSVSRGRAGRVGTGLPRAALRLAPAANARFGRRRPIDGRQPADAAVQDEQGQGLVADRHDLGRCPAPEGQCRRGRRQRQRGRPRRRRRRPVPRRQRDGHNLQLPDQRRPRGPQRGVTGRAGRSVAARLRQATRTGAATATTRGTPATSAGVTAATTSPTSSTRTATATRASSSSASTRTSRSPTSTSTASRPRRKDRAVRLTSILLCCLGLFAGPVWRRGRRRWPSAAATARFTLLVDDKAFLHRRRRRRRPPAAAEERSAATPSAPGVPTTSAPNSMRPSGSA